MDGFGSRVYIRVTTQFRPRDDSFAVSHAKMNAGVYLKQIKQLYPPNKSTYDLN